MTTKALEEVLEKLGRPLTDPHCATLVASARAELTALSSVPEDVARDAETVGYSLGIGTQAQCDSALAALSRLATAAARVPGLEVKVATIDADRERAWQRASAAESERDAARQEVASVAQQMNDAARSNSDESTHLRESIRALTARVAELERENERLSKHHADRCDERNAAEARATAAEARIQEVLKACEQMEQRYLSEARDYSEPLRTAYRYGAGVAKVLGAVARDTATPTPAPGLRESVKNALTGLDRDLGPLNDYFLRLVIWRATSILKSALAATPPDVTNTAAPSSHGKPS